MERWESDEDSDQSEEERDRDVDAAEGLQLSEMAVVRLRLCIRIHWIHCVSGPCKNTQNTYLTSRVGRDENICALQPEPLHGCFHSYGFEVWWSF